MSKQDLKKVESHFNFGKNWERYSALINEERIKIAEQSLIKLLGKNNIKDKTFLDIGCGSGLFSLAALNLGAKQVFAIDIDQNSVNTTKAVIKKHANHMLDKFSCQSCSVFDLSKDTFDKASFDVVFSWGVLHHTGSMNEAIIKASTFVSEDGKLALSLYYKTRLCNFWTKIKRFYTNSKQPTRTLLNYFYICFFILEQTIVARINVFKYIKNYKNNRGMSFTHDVIDWLGGFPYESITNKELEQLLTTNGFTINKDLSFHGDKIPLGILCSGCCEYLATRKN